MRDYLEIAVEAARRGGDINASVDLPRSNHDQPGSVDLATL